MWGKSIVLCVDADPALKRTVCELTVRLQCEFASFTSAEEFLSSRVFSEWSRIREAPRRVESEQTTERAIACLVSELTLPGMSGLELLRWLRERHLLLPSIFVTSCGDLRTATELVKHGAMDVLGKPVVDGQLQDAVESGIRHSPSLLRFEKSCQEQKQRLSKLTEREREVLDRLLRRMPVKQIAVELGTSPHTVRNQRQSVLQKLAADGDAELLMIVLSVRMHEHGLYWPLLPVFSRE